MKQLTFILICVIFLCCKSTNEVQTVSKLSKKLKEVSGVEKIKNSELIWVHNDSGNENILYGINKKGVIKKEINVQSKNVDWEDITSDKKGNIYIGDFGNNDNKRKNLRILKISSKNLGKKNAEVDVFEFEYENQYKFPPKKKNKHFDAEAFFYKKNNFYIFTKSRVKSNYGQTNLYKVAVKRGKQTAKLISSYKGCNSFECRITAADISPNGKIVALLNLKSILLFTNFKGDDFLSGTVTEIPLGFESQKEGICFIDNNSLYITDEKSHGKGGKLYTIRLN